MSDEIEEISEQEGRQFVAVHDAIELADLVCTRAWVSVDWVMVREWWLEFGGVRYDRIDHATVNRLVERAIAFRDEWHSTIGFDRLR
jgi:hypothetical protein